MKSQTARNRPGASIVQSRIGVATDPAQADCQSRGLRSDLEVDIDVIEGIVVALVVCGGLPCAVRHTSPATPNSALLIVGLNQGVVHNVAGADIPQTDIAFLGVGVDVNVVKRIVVLLNVAGSLTDDVFDATALPPAADLASLLVGLGHIVVIVVVGPNVLETDVANGW